MAKDAHSLPSSTLTVYLTKGMNNMTKELMEAARFYDPKDGSKTDARSTIKLACDYMDGGVWLADYRRVLRQDVVQHDEDTTFGYPVSATQR
jgi:hypothetical protein